jgi:adenine-specific DNA-methyltransferase
MQQNMVKSVLKDGTGMAKRKATKTTLTWPGKQQEETFPQSAPDLDLTFAIRERLRVGKAREDASEEWRNQLIWGDNLLVMRALLDRFAGKIDLIYIDPPFATGTDFHISSSLSNDPTPLQSPPRFQHKAYRDSWGGGLSVYLSMLWQRLPLLRTLLSDTGSIYIHLGWDISSYVLTLMNEVFGEDCLQNIIIYNYGTFHHSKERWKRDFDAILFYSKNPTAWTFNHNAVRDPYRHRTEIRFDKVDEVGRRYKIVKGRRVYYQGGVTPSSVWRLSNLQVNAAQSLGYPTQKTEALLTKIIAASSNPGDLVADFFCGSGTTLAVAENLGRRWIGCDSSRVALHTTRKRLLTLPGCTPFDILDLDRSERRYWHRVTFGRANETQEPPACSPYHGHILTVYGAQPLSGNRHIHGIKGTAMVHIGAVDAPVTSDDLTAAMNACVSAVHSTLHVLGWEWQPELLHWVIAEAQRRGIEVRLLQIPREVMEAQAVAKGDIQFFAVLGPVIAIERPEAMTITVTLTGPTSLGSEHTVTDQLATDSRRMDTIDSWAVDWDYCETFTPAWAAHRTRKDHALRMTSAPHHYERPGTYHVVVKIVDIFGNEASRFLTVEV